MLHKISARTPDKKSKFHFSDFSNNSSKLALLNLETIWKNFKIIVFFRTTPKSYIYKKGKLSKGRQENKGRL